MSLFICAHLITSPCAYALESASHSVLESTTAQVAQSIPTPPHTTQPPSLQPTALAEQISLAQSNTPQLLAPHAPQPALPQPLAPQLDTLQSPTQLHTPPPSTPILESNLPSKRQSLDSALQSHYLQESNSLDLHLQGSYLPNPNSLDSHLQEHSLLDSLPITPDASTPSLSPTITCSPNHIEIINITTPNSKGISNNHYIDFNIKPKGAILNNSLQSITSTHLAGLISSNPHLKDSYASLILNQVTSANPSYLLGMLEVAGDKASVLIANPNGIVCKSCEFGNVANLALSTALIEDKLTLDEKWLNNTTSAFASTLINNTTNTFANTINPTHTTNPTNNTSPTNTNGINTINTTSNTNPTHNTNATAPFASTTASLYASSTLNISAKSITNTHSTIYAGDTLSIKTDTLKNTQGSIYASSALAIYANTIDNIDIASTKTHLQSKQYITQGNLKQVGDKHFWRSVYVDRLDSFSPSIIASSGDTHILAHTLRNHNSYISASNSLNIQARNASNTQTQAYQKVVDNGVEVRNYQYTYWENYAGVRGVFCGIFTLGICNIRELRTVTAQGVFTYAPPHTISKIKLDFPSLDTKLEPNIARLNTSIANKISSTSEINNANALFSTISSVYDNARYDDRESFVRSRYFYQQFASRDSSQANVFLANLDLESKAIFYNSSAFLSNTLDTKALSNSQAKHLTSLALHQHYHNNQYSQPYNSGNTLKHTQYIYGNTPNNTHNNTANIPHNNLALSLKSSDSTRHNLSFLAHSIGFSGDFIAIDSHTFSNDSALQGGKVDLHTSEALAHLGDIKAKDITLQSDGTLYIGGGDIQARDKAYLQAKHISIDSLITTSKGYTPTTHANNANRLNHTGYASHTNYTNQARYASHTNYASQLSTRFAPFHSVDSITTTSTLKAGSLFYTPKILPLSLVQI